MKRNYSDYPEYGMWLEENMDASTEEQKKAKEWYNMRSSKVLDRAIRTIDGKLVDVTFINGHSMKVYENPDGTANLFIDKKFVKAYESSFKASTKGTLMLRNMK